MKSLNVFYDGLKQKIKFGVLGMDGKGNIFFEIDSAFPIDKFALSPFEIKDHFKLQEGKFEHFKGLHGVFNDSLPDGWGLLLMDKAFQKQNFDRHNITPLTRLAYMGDRAMGALSYEPDVGTVDHPKLNEFLNLKAMADNAIQVLEGSSEEVLEALYITGGSPGGARPKATIGLSLDGSAAISGANDLPQGFEHWMVKFPSSKKPDDIFEGTVEFVFSNCARQCYIPFPETKLINAPNSPGFFAIKRFDRNLNQKVHMHTLSGVIGADFRKPDLDYTELVKVSKLLTKSQEFNYQIIQQMVFNIIAGNRDDHTKNFSFLMDDEGEWSLSPAYDITFSEAVRGYHSMDIAGESKDISIQAIEKVAEAANVNKNDLNQILQVTCQTLSNWEVEAAKFNVPKDLTKHIQGYINKQIKRLA